ncbi:MAG TPA: Hpt domain-containing protein, partial [Gemmatimonadales bacterium]|nr:Hpt domain-containing protein [Gemmatimonadales bacterium]
MDLSQYADLFLAESREHLSACNQLLLQWERAPASAEPLGGLFRSVHTVKGMAATMGYARVADLAHRMENLLDRLRTGVVAPSGDMLQLLFRGIDLLEKSIGLAVAGREKDVDVAGLGAELDVAAQHRGGAPAGKAARGRRSSRTAAPAVGPPVGDAPVEASSLGRLVSVTLRAEAPLKGGRALLVLRRARDVGAVAHVSPPEATFESDDFDGRFSFRLDAAVEAAEIERALARAGDVERVTVSEQDAAAGRSEGAGADRSRHIRVD